MAIATLISEEDESAREFLFGLPMFAGITDLPLRRGADLTPAAEFLSICQEYTFESGTVIAHKLDIAEGMYIFRRGTVDSWDVHFNNERREQEFEWKKSFTAEDILGDVWLFESGQHRSLLRARRAGSFILIKKSDFLKFINTHKVVLRQMYPHMSPKAQDEIYRSGLAPYLKSSGLFNSDKSRQDQAELIGEDGAVIRNLPAPVQNIQLLQDEVIFYHSQRSWKIAYLRLVLGAAIALVLFVAVYVLLLLSGFGQLISLGAAGLAALIPLLNGLVYWIDWRNAFFLVTSNQLIRSEKKLLQFNSALEKIDINKVQSISIEKSNFLQKWFNVGTAQITTAAQGTVLYFDYVDKPEEIELAIKEVLQHYSSLEMGKRRAEMRSIINNHFGVQGGIKKVGGFKPAPRSKGFMEKVRENFVRSEGSDGITYHKHPIALIRFMVAPTIAFVVLVSAWLGLRFFGADLLQIPAMFGVMVFLTIANLFWFWWEFEDWHNDTFQITKRYIYDIDRLPLGLSESRKQAELNRIENVRTEKDGFFPTLFNYGAVHVETAGAENNIVFENVKDPDSVQAAIFKKRNEYEKMLEQRGAAGSLDMMTTLIEMYDEANKQSRIHQFRPLPEPDDEYDEEYE